jgi:hypothetical protein
MQAFKVIGLGLLFSFIGTIAYLLEGIFRSNLSAASMSSAHATGLSAVFAGFMEATVFNPFYWLGILLAFGLAFWFTRKFRAAT